MATSKSHTPNQVERKLATVDRMLNEGEDGADVCPRLSHGTDQFSESGHGS